MPTFMDTTDDAVSSSTKRSVPVSETGCSLKGSCLCGKVRYRLDGIVPDRVAHCHCIHCRKFHGAAFSTFVQPLSWRWTSGVELIQAYVLEDNGATRQFCCMCGTSLTFQGKDGPIEFALATADGKVDHIAPDAHVFVDRRVPWFVIRDDLPQYARARKDAQATCLTAAVNQPTST